MDITPVYDQKVYALAAHESQFFEWLPWTTGQLDEVPKGEKERLEWLAEQRRPTLNEKEKQSLIKWYGQEKASQVKYAEAFEICEYGKQPSDDEIRELFPMFEK